MEFIYSEIISILMILFTIGKFVYRIKIIH